MPDVPNNPTRPLPPGRIDIHCHLIPGIDDGCSTLDESLDCVRRLIKAGFVGSVCTPHMWPDSLPNNTPAHVRQWTADLQREIDAAGLDYRVWPGGELRMFDGAVAWMQAHGVPRLGNSRCVLLDYWDRRWPKWANDLFGYLTSRRYQPILAHPERLPFDGAPGSLESVLRDVQAQGVWLQGNYRCMTGEDGYAADQVVRQLLTDNRYQLMALDMHGPDSLESRLDGLALAEAEFGREAVQRLTEQAPRKWVVREG